MAPADPSDPPDVTPDDSDRDYVTSFARGLEVIRAFTRNCRSMTLSEVAVRTGMNRAATRRFLLTLVREGYAETDGKKFQLLPKILDLGFSALASLGLTTVVQPVLDELSETLQESCFAVILEGESVVYVAKSHSRRVMVASVDIGSRAPAYTMSSGRVLLSALGEDALEKYLAGVKLEPLTPYTVTSKVKLKSIIEEARHAGYCIVDQEYEVGLRSISVPIRSRGGQTIAALNAACPSPRFTLDDMRARVLPKLLESANAVTRFLS
ncbi:IclR family transcriptional regulator domain-containing protein [Labrys neptuniae]